MIRLTEIIFGKWQVSNFPTIFQNVLTTNGKLWGYHRYPWRFSENLALKHDTGDRIQFY